MKINKSVWYCKSITWMYMCAYSCARENTCEKQVARVYCVKLARELAQYVWIWAVDVPSIAFARDLRRRANSGASRERERVSGHSGSGSRSERSWESEPNKEREVRSQELLPKGRPAAGTTNLERVSKSEGESKRARVSRDCDVTGVVARACESSRVPHPRGKVVVVAFLPSGEGTSWVRASNRVAVGGR